MSTEGAKLTCCEWEAEKSDDGAARHGPNVANLPGCCGSTVADATDGWPCASVLKGHRRLCYAIFAVVGLALLISQLGGILGIIAFFRTL